MTGSSDQSRPRRQGWWIVVDKHPVVADDAADNTPSAPDAYLSAPLSRAVS